MNKDLEELFDKGLNYEEVMDVCRMETRRRISDTLKQFMPYYDTPEGKILLEEQLYGILIQMLSFIQVNNRRFRKERQAEGIEAARANGVQLGRRKKFVADDYIEIFRRLENGEINKRTARAEIGASPNTFDRLLKEVRLKGLL
ncbi:MAG: hypothetical protein IJ736_02475 [Firmicutes bacterium]|nr:hypothetical protein [Bacillota bacterium]